MSDELERNIAASNAQIDQISGSLREMLTNLYSAGLGNVVVDGCTEHIKQLMVSEHLGERLIGSFAFLGMTRSLASVGEALIADIDSCQGEDTP